MKKWICWCLCFAVAPAVAENWVRYAQSGEIVRYYDKMRMMNMSGTAFIWDMHDLKTPVTDASGKSYQSVLYPTEFSCRKLTHRVLSARRMSGSMGEGALVSEHNIAGPWKDVMSHSPEEELMKAVCESQ